MSRLLVLCVAAGLLVLSAVVAQEPADSVAVETEEPAEPVTLEGQISGEVFTVDAVLTTGVENRMPLDTTVDTIQSDIEQLYCWSKVEGVKDSISIFHVWLHGDVERARVELPVKSSSWRTWSSKYIRSDWTGPWEVRILAPDGDVQKSLKFYVKPAAETPVRDEPEDTTGTQ